MKIAVMAMDLLAAWAVGFGQPTMEDYYRQYEEALKQVDAGTFWNENLPEIRDRLMRDAQDCVNQAMGLSGAARPRTADPVAPVRPESKALPERRPRTTFPVERDAPLTAREYEAQRQERVDSIASWLIYLAVGLGFGFLWRSCAPPRGGSGRAWFWIGPCLSWLSLPVYWIWAMSHPVLAKARAC